MTTHASRHVRVILLLCLIGLLAPAAPGQDDEHPAPDAPDAVESRPFEWDVTVPPGGYAYARFDATTGSVTRHVTTPIASGPTYGADDPRLDRALTDAARRALAIAPAWLRRDLAIKLADLRSQPVRVEAAVRFRVEQELDGNGDGTATLRVIDAAGKPVGEPVIVCDRHAIDLASKTALSARCSTLAGEPRTVELIDGTGAVHETLRVPFAPRDVVLFDVEGDHAPDLLLLDETGLVRVLRNHGRADAPRFIVPRHDSLRALPDCAQTAVAPRLMRVRDMIGLIVGTQDGRLRTLVRRNGEWRQHLDQEFPALSNIVPGVADNAYVIAGVRDGRLVRISTGMEITPLFDGKTFGTYAAPAIGDVDGDGRDDLIVCTREGKVWFGRGVETPEGAVRPSFEMPAPVAGLELKSAVPTIVAAHQVLVGLPDGTLQLWSNATGTFARVEGTPYDGMDVGEFAAPALCDMDGDGTDELVVGNGNGQLTMFVRSGAHLVERDSWSFEPMAGLNTLDDYYARAPGEFPALRAPTDAAAVDAFAGELLRGKPEWRDEIASVVATTPTEVLRAMHRLGQTDIVTRNARMVYEMAGIAKYARLTDNADGTTTLELNTQRGWVTVPQAVYYRFVVHPRILFEIPSRVDVSWWATSAAGRGMSHDDWLRHDGGMLYGTSDAHQFWRESLLTDEMKQRRLIDYVKDCETQEDAIFALSRYLSYDEPDAFMSFGYLTNDLQPLLIYAKGYGSCGETSTICSTVCRLLLIPAYIVGCRGEDHQWSEVFDAHTGQFVVWNCDAGAAGFGHIWGPGEGGNHKGKTISTIMAFGPDDAIWPTTTSAANPANSGYMPGDKGYTPTARLNVRVVDAAGVPVDGAMVVARSHWNRANMLSMLGYTDLDGRCGFDLGWEPHGGYTIDVLSSLGTAGSMNLPVTEGETYDVTYRLPGTLPARQAIRLDTAGEVARGARLVLHPAEAAHAQRIYPRSFFTGQRYRITSQIAATTGYTGTRWYPHDLSATCGAAAMIMDEANFARYERGEACSARPLGEQLPAGNWYLVVDNRHSLHVWQRCVTAFDVVSPAAPPTVHLARTTLAAPLAGAAQGGPIAGRATDASGIARVDLSVDGHAWSPIAIDAEGRFEIAWDGRVAGRVVVPGAHTLHVRATDHAGMTTTQRVTLQVAPARSLPAQRIRQDNASDPLSATWVLGPFRIPADERSLSVTTRGHTAGMDVDVFLYADRNGNRTRETNEKIADSTTPTSNERLFVMEPDTAAVYWLYVHGWQVPEGDGELDVTLSFVPQAVRIVDVTPVGATRECAAIGARLLDSETTPVTARVDGVEWTCERDAEGRVVLHAPDERDLPDGAHTVTLDTATPGGASESCSWTFTLDRQAPSVADLQAEPAGDFMALRVQVTDNGTGDGVTGVTATLAGGKAVALKRDTDDPGVWTGRVSRADVKSGTADCVIRATDRAGNVGVTTTSLTLPGLEPAPPVADSPARFFRIHPGNTPDSRPTFRAYWTLRDGLTATRVHVRVTNAAGDVVAEREQAASPLGYVAFRPVEALPPGEYHLHIELGLQGENAPDAPATHDSAFVVAPMNWQPGEKR